MSTRIKRASSPKAGTGHGCPRSASDETSNPLVGGHDLRHAPATDGNPDGNAHGTPTTIMVDRTRSAQQADLRWTAVDHPVPNWKCRIGGIFIVGSNPTLSAIFELIRGRRQPSRGVAKGVPDENGDANQREKQHVGDSAQRSLRLNTVQTSRAA